MKEIGTPRLRRLATFSVLSALVVAIQLSTTSREVAASSSPSSLPTFSSDIAPILTTKCVTCHQVQGDAPFPLQTFDQVRRRASQIVQVIENGYMPPWKPGPDSMSLVGERRLSPEQKTLIRRWVQSGMPEGSPSVSRAEATTGDSWLWGKPDLVISLPAYVLPSGSGDVFRNFVVRVPYDGTRYVRGFQFRPGSRAVHHANIRIDPTSASADLDAADPGPGYEGVILHSADYPEGHFLGWTPGQSPPPADELAWPLVGRTWFVIQLHMRATGKLENVHPSIGLYFTDRPPVRATSMIRLGRQDLLIPAGQRDFTTVDSFVTPVAATLRSIQPHAHYRARDVQVTAELPDGSTRMLLHIADWDFNWQDQYQLAQPLRVPPGTKFTSAFSFDNSEANPRNPSYPLETVQWGWRSSDEMADVWLQVLTDTADDERTLDVAAQQKATREDAVGVEVLIAREPDHFNLRNDAGSIYLELQQPEKALEHFSAARRLKPTLASTAYNVGVALEALGRLDEALSQYRDAIAIDADYAPAHIRLGAIQYQSGRTRDAIMEYEIGLRLSPELVRARCELARIFTETDRPLESVHHYQLALKVDSNNLACLINFTWLLAANDRAEIRNSREAIELGERAVTLSRDRISQALALDALAAAFASADRFDEAVERATKALSLVDDRTQRDALLDRLSLYRRRVAFVVTSLAGHP